MSPLYTAGAQRCLQRAAAIAVSLQAVEIISSHVLWALWLDESHAAELLQHHGVVVDDLHELCPLAEVHIAGSTARQLETQPLGSESPDYSSELHAALLAAERVVVDRGPDFELSSLELLAGLAAVESAVQPLLLGRGLFATDATDEPQDDATGSVMPLETDIRLAIPRVQEVDLTDAHRLIDAAANRAREGLRVAEDYVRFSLDDRRLTELLKRWRHSFTEQMQRIDSQGLIQSRDTRRDVGTTITTRMEQQRSTLRDVAIAAFKRTQEAVRSLEETTKVITSVVSPHLEQLRYELYTLEKAVFQTESSRSRLAHQRLYLLLTESLCPNGSGPLLRTALEAGVSIVQLREKSMPDKHMIAHARRVREWTRTAGATLIINDRPDIAALVDADGVHLGQDDMSVHDARRIVGPNRLVGVSTHSLSQLDAALLDGADYVGVGPTFPTSTKSFQEFAGLEYVRTACGSTRLPAYPIGGIGAENIADVIAAGADRVAVSSAVCCAADPAAVIRQFFAALDQASFRETTPVVDNQ